MVILDTSIIIDHLRQKENRDSCLITIVKDHPNEIIAISIISIQELYEGGSTKDKNKERYLIKILDPLEIIPYTEEVAKLAGKIARDLNRPIELADAAIAASVILDQASLATLNQKDFRNINNLKIL